MKLRCLSTVICMAVPGFTDALPRGSSSERRGDRELQLSLVGYERTGGAASFLGAKVGQMREPLILPPPKLPKPLSDHTATIWNGLIYIAGGCDSPYVFDQRTFTYTCSSVSESFFVFDPSQYIDHFSSLENLPRPRYRHTSVILDNQIWLVGGRNVDGGLVEFVDVFDIEKGGWLSFQLPDPFKVSDHAAFFHDEFVYIAGGYDQNLEAKETVFRINTHLSTESLVIEEMDPLLNFSGELLAIQTSQHVYVASGYTNFGCDGSGIIQRYDFAADGWKTLAPFRGRKHFGMVQLNDIVMLLGGEKLSAEFCSNMIADSKSALTPIDSIEALIPGQWIEVASTKSMHCRFPAVSSQAENSVFTFGGLGAYDENCDCFPVLTEVVEYFHLLSQALSTLESHGQTETDSQTTVPITSFAESQTESSTVPPQTPAPVPPQTPAPVPQPTPAPVLPQTPAPMPQPTPAPVSPQTPAPVPQPTSAPVSPQTPAPIPQPTPAPIPPQTPAPIPQPTLVPIPPQTPAPVTRPTPAPLQIATYPPARTGELTFYGGSPPDSRYPLGICEGDCDKNTDCEADLICFQRGKNEPVPGCSGTDGSASDYCIDPNAFHIPAGGNGSNDSESYIPGKLNVQKLGLLLSEGLDARLIATTGELVRYANGQSSSTVFHGRPDAGATFSDTRPENHGGWIYVSNSEMETLGDGGVGSFTFDKDGNLLDYQMILERTTKNCGGGRTPWNTWVSCEEIEDKTGKIYQVDPMGQREAQLMTLGGEGGRWESFAYDIRDASNPHFFVTEDDEFGALSRFTPHEPDWVNPWSILHGEGSIDYLRLNFHNSNSGTFEWTKNKQGASLSAKHGYAWSEGIDVRKNELFFVCKFLRKIYTLDLDKGTWYRESTASGLFDGNPDQLARILQNPRDLLYFTEEGDTDAGVHARDENARFYTIMESPTYPGETTGLSLSPDGKFMYVSYQDVGKLFCLWRRDGKAFGAEHLDVKFHNS